MLAVGGEPVRLAHSCADQDVLSFVAEAGFAFAAVERLRQLEAWAHFLGRLGGVGTVSGLDS